MRSPSDFQRKVFNTLAVMGLSQVQIYRNPDGSYRLESSAVWKRILYFFMRINSAFKLLYLVLLSLGFFQTQFDFLEKMAILLWLLIFVIITVSDRLFYRKYPFFEILTAWWKVEESVHKGLGHPTKFNHELKYIALRHVCFQGMVAAVGVLAAAVQYDAAPKSCIFVYSLFATEDATLKWIAGAHEIFFIIYGWLVFGSAVYMCSVMGAESTYVMDALRAVMDVFINHGYSGMATYRRRAPPGSGEKSVKTSSRAGRLRLDSPILKDQQAHDQLVDEDESLIKLSKLEFDLYGMLKECLHVAMIVSQLNSFAAYNLLYLFVIDYVQCISDVYQIVQILRSDAADFGAIMFFAEDMCVTMYMLFRCFKSMAFLQPSSVSFLEKYKVLLTSRHVRRPHRALMTKLQPTLHITAMKIGPCTVGPWTVGSAMDVLLQYYICVALWP